jgi:hypothetical protein
MPCPRLKTKPGRRSMLRQMFCTCFKVEGISYT